MLEQIDAAEIEEDRTDQAEAKIERHRRQEHARPVWLGSVPQLRQSVGRRARKTEIQKAEIPEKNPDNRNDAVTSVADVMHVNGNGHDSDRQPHHGIDEVENKVSPERCRRHAYPSPRVEISEGFEIASPRPHRRLCFWLTPKFFETMRHQQFTVVASLSKLV